MARRTVLLSLFLALGSLAARDLNSAERAAVEVESVLVPVVVADGNGRPVAGLQREDFRLLLDGKAAAIEYFEGGDAPLVIALAIDASASMVGRRFEAARRAAHALVERLDPRDRALLIAFDHRARLLAPLGTEPVALHAAIEAMSTGGGTALYDALALAIRTLGSEPGRKALLLLTDGEDALSAARPGEVEGAARRAQVVPYCVWLGGAGQQSETAALARLATDLGGRSLYPSSDDQLMMDYVEILEEMRSQYTLGFSPERRSDGRWHRIDVELSRPELRHLQVRARRGWLAGSAR